MNQDSTSDFVAFGIMSLKSMKGTLNIIPQLQVQQGRCIHGGRGNFYNRLKFLNVKMINLEYNKIISPKTKRERANKMPWLLAQNEFHLV